MIYDILYENLIGAKPLRIKFDKIDGFIRIYDDIKCLTLFGSEKYEVIYNRIRYLIGVKIRIAYIFYTKIKVDFYDLVSIEKIFTLHNVIIHFKLIWMKIKITTTTIYLSKIVRINA